MLKCTSIFNIEDKKKLLQNFNPDKDVWITSDIKSREFITHRLNLPDKKNGHQCVFRASDFWLFLLSTIEPNYQLISRTGLIFLYQQWAKSQADSWKQSKETGAIVCQYLHLLVHLLQHPDRDDLMQEWFISLPGKSPHWKQWYYLAREFWDYLQQKNIIESSWADVYLLDKTKQTQSHWEKIIFDLGCHINRVEVELIHQLSDHQQVQVLMPVIFKDQQGQLVSDMYQPLTKEVSNFSLSKVNATDPERTNHSDHLIVKKFATQLSEVKDVTYEVSQAIQKGISPNKIAVLAPHIEDYWTCLSSYFRKEGIAVNKKNMSFLFSFPLVQLWLARMWTHLDIVRYENLETILANKEHNISFNQFRSSYYQEKQIKNIPSDCYQKQYLRNKDQIVHGAEFVAWALSLYPDKERPDSVLHNAVQECLNQITKLSGAFHQRVHWQSWLSLLETMFKSKEIMIHEESVNGIHCLSFNALSWLEADYVYIVGVNEQNLKQSGHHMISSLEADALIRDMGFFVKMENVDSLQQSILHFIQNHKGNIIISCAVNDFYGVVLNPASLWLDLHSQQENKNEELKNSITNPKTAWDQQQRRLTVKDILRDRNIPFPSADLVEQSLKEDDGCNKLEYFYLNSLDKMKNISYSLLDEYVRCPFIFSAQRLFGLWDREIQDMDRLPMERGRLIHQLFQQIKENLSDQQTISDEEILNIIDDIYSKAHSQTDNADSTKRHKFTIYPLHAVMQDKEKTFLFKKTKQFLDHEQQRKNVFLNYKNVGCETEWQGYWNNKTHSLSSDTGDWPFKGYIDRIDSDGRSYLALDYKGSLPDGAGAKSWIDKSQFQLALYIQALEKGVTELPALPVDFALFLSYKDFTYKGMALKEKWINKQSFCGLSNRSHSLISEQDKQQILNNINQKISQIIKQIQAGDFTPNPQDKTKCQKCSWRHICRASHLN